MIDGTTDPLFDLKDRSIVVFGACGGLGRPLSRALAARGAHLTLADRDSAVLNDMAAELGLNRHKDNNDSQTIATHITDITDEAACDETMATASRAFGRVDGVVNTAGVLSVDAGLTLDPVDFQRSLDLNVTAALLISRAAARTMAPNGGGAILHMASVSSLVANPNYAAYATSKAALSQLIRVLAREWASDGIRINALGPAMTETPLNAGYLADETFRANALAVIPMGRFGEPDDLIGPAVMMLAPSSNFITGQTLYVDGGRTLV